MTILAVDIGWVPVPVSKLPAGAAEVEGKAGRASGTSDDWELLPNKSIGLVMMLWALATALANCCTFVKVFTCSPIWDMQGAEPRLGVIVIIVGWIVGEAKWVGGGQQGSIGAAQGILLSLGAVRENLLSYRVSVDGAFGLIGAGGLLLAKAGLVSPKVLLVI
uniref:Uncharacterized protein n=1 Tax=Romanomermis culicivorax TaxID=13658 RepID=A0A915KT71_ROMCU